MKGLGRDGWNFSEFPIGIKAQACTRPGKEGKRCEAFQETESTCQLFFLNFTPDIHLFMDNWVNLLSYLNTQCNGLVSQPVIIRLYTKLLKQKSRFWFVNLIFYKVMSLFVIM